MEDYERDLCVRGFHMYCDIYAVLGSVPSYVSAISGAVAIVCALFSPLPYLDVLLRYLFQHVTADSVKCMPSLNGVHTCEVNLIAACVCTCVWVPV